MADIRVAATRRSSSSFAMCAGGRWSKKRPHVHCEDPQQVAPLLGSRQRALGEPHRVHGLASFPDPNPPTAWPNAPPNAVPYASVFPDHLHSSVVIRTRRPSMLEESRTLPRLTQENHQRLLPCLEFLVVSQQKTSLKVPTYFVHHYRSKFSEQSLPNVVEGMLQATVASGCKLLARRFGGTVDAVVPRSTWLSR